MLFLTPKVRLFVKQAPLLCKNLPVSISHCQVQTGHPRDQGCVTFTPVLPCARHGTWHMEGVQKTLIVAVERSFRS